MSELKPCPFCGGKADVIGIMMDKCICSECEAQAKGSCNNEIAILRWNTRAQALKWRSAEEKPENESYVLFETKNGTETGKTIIITDSNEWYIECGSFMGYSKTYISRDIKRWIPLSEVLAVIK